MGERSWSASCSCFYPQIQRYRSEISGPLMDRIDLHMEVPSVDYKELSAKEAGMSSGGILESAMEKPGLSARAHSRILKIAR